jgi:hypothetical protein
MCYYLYEWFSNESPRHTPEDAMTEHIRTARPLAALAHRLGVEEYRLGMFAALLALPVVSAVIAAVAA